MRKCYLPLLLMILVACSSASAKTKIVTVKLATDSEAMGFEAYRAMDGDPLTMWHSKWGTGETELPHDLIVDLGRSYPISGFVYEAREGLGNGTINDYELYVYDDPKKMGKPAAKGAFPNKGTKNVIEFTGKKVTGVSLGPEEDGTLRIRDKAGGMHTVLSGDVNLVL